MRRWFAAGLASAVLAVGLIAPVAAEEHPFCTSGRDFGEHVSTMARDGQLSGEHNPGMHQGYSVCVTEPDE